MKIIPALQIPRKLFRQTRFHALAACCFGLLAVDSFADDTFHVKEEETQLAKRFAVRESVESPFEYSLSGGYRKDNLNWSIADGGINVASEVDWKNTVIAQMRATAKVHLWQGLQLLGTYSTGAVISGSNRDSDYAGSNRTQEYSRSDNQTGGAVRDLSIGLGYKFRLFDLVPGISMTLVPQAGLSIHQQSLTMYDGQQTVPANGAIIGLNNSYNAQWKGPWLGMDVLLDLGEHFSLNTGVEYHRADYSADANWNLRSDFKHPVSFSHVAQGNGTLVSVGIAYRFSRSFQINTSLERQKWNTYQGYDQTNFSYGATNYYTLNPVSWDSTTWSLGAVYQF
jgi:hypothetical protein